MYPNAIAAIPCAQQRWNGVAPQFRATTFIRVPAARGSMKGVVWLWLAVGSSRTIDTAGP
jgi:hypothetical protein